MKDMGIIDIILWIRIVRDNNGTLSQSHSIEKVLKKLNLFLFHTYIYYV